jgi:hypothetical protein
MRPWKRPKYVEGGGDAHVSIAVFTTREVTGLTVSRSRHGIVEDAARYDTRIDYFGRDERPDRFEELESPAVLGLAESDGLEVESLASAQHQMAVELAMPDPPDAEHLRLVWGYVRALCDAVPVLGILDRHAARWWTPAMLQAIPVSAAFDPRREVSVIFETSPRRQFGHVCHTRGLRKFGRPDVILTDLTERHADLAGQVLHELAAHLAIGAIVEPGDELVLRLGAGKVSAYVAGGNAPQLNLNNRGLVLSSDGRR